MKPTETTVKSTSGSVPVYQLPPWIMRNVFDPLTRFLVGKLGMDDHNGTRVIEVQGRTSGKWRATPVKLLELDGKRYVVAMYGETQWARNLRAHGNGRLRFGSHSTEFQAKELADVDKLPVLRAYYTRWWSLVARMTTVTSPAAPDEEITKEAPLHPVFRLDQATNG